MMPLKKELEYFLALSKTLNMSQAAEKIGVQQAGLSKSLKNLEEQLGKGLFYRTNRGLMLTPYGEVLLKSLNKTLNNWYRDFEKDVNLFEHISGRFKIGMHPALAQNFSPLFLPELCESYPELYPELVFLNSGEITKLVIDHSMHFGIVANPMEHPDLVIKPLAKEFIGCWRNQECKEVQKVLYYNPDMIELARKLKDFNNYKKVAIKDYEVIVKVLLNSNGIGLLPSSVSEKYQQLCLYQKKLSQVKVCLIYRHDMQKTRATDVILDHIKKGLR